jgi:hypothetical protein
MEMIVRVGAMNQAVRFMLAREDGGGAQTGLAAGLDSLCAAYIRDGELTPAEIPLHKWEDSSRPTAGGFREIDAQLMPGLYELILPDQVCAAGAQRATLMVWSPALIPQIVHINLVAYDPYDRDRLGLDCLTRDGRHGVISRAFQEVVPEIVEDFLRKE